MLIFCNSKYSENQEKCSFFTDGKLMEILLKPFRGDGKCHQL